MSESLVPTLEQYVQDARSDLQAIWSSWKLDLSKNEVHEVVGGLLARQVSLATEMVRNPDIWNPHIAPLILRSMVDLYITLSWILLNPDERAKQFIAYGLGQIKLRIEHLKAALSAGEGDESTQQMIDVLEDWHNAQRFTFLTEVNIGSWSGLNTRKMAEEAGCLYFYQNVYTVFSEAAHSMWHHVKVHNLELCTNPLHRLHSVPHSPEIPPNAYYLHVGAKYLEQTFLLARERLGLQPSEDSAFDRLMNSLDELTRPASEGEGLEHERETL